MTFYWEQKWLVVCVLVFEGLDLLLAQGQTPLGDWGAAGVLLNSFTGILILLLALGVAMVKPNMAIVYRRRKP